MKRQIKCMLHATALAMLLLCCAINAGAQNFIVYAPANTDPVTIGSITSPPVSINNAVYTHGAGTVWGEIYEDGAGNNTWANKIRFHLKDNFGTNISTTVNGPTAAGNYELSQPDIVIGGLYNCNESYMGIVYTARETTSNNKNVYMEIYKINNVGSSSPVMSLSNCNVFVHQLSTSNDAFYPHVDLINSITPHCGAAEIYTDTFAVSWQDAACKVNNYGVNSCWGSLKYGFTGCSVSSTIHQTGCVNSGKDAVEPDVSAFKRTANGKLAGYVYVDPATGILYGRNLRIPAGTFSTEQTLDNTATSISKPRVEVFEGDLGTNPGIEVVYNAYYATTATTGVMSMNQGVSPIFGQMITQWYTPGTATNNNYSPTVTSNVPDYISSGPYLYFAAAYSCPPVTKTLVNMIDISTGLVTQDGSGNNEYYTVNSNTGTLGQAMAITDEWLMYCSGPNCIQLPRSTYTCWYNGTNTEINCKKVTAYPPGYKPGPSGVEEVTTRIRFVSAYPNPATDKLYLSDLGDAESYVINDMAGRSVGTGSMTGVTQAGISIAELPAGNYMLQVLNKDKSTDNVKFAKK